MPDGIIRRPAVAFDDRKSSSGSAIGATGADGIDGGADGGAVDEAPSSRAVALLKSNFSLTTPILASSACSFSAADCRSSASASSSEMREALPSRSAVRSSICLLAAASCSAASDDLENSLRSRLNLVLDRQMTRPPSGRSRASVMGNPVVPASYWKLLMIRFEFWRVFEGALDPWKLLPGHLLLICSSIASAFPLYTDYHR